jgi:hypothetical protein
MMGWVGGRGRGVKKPRLTSKSKKNFFALRKENVNLTTFETPPVKNALCSSLRESFSTCFLIKILEQKSFRLPSLC